ncbi:hypothetical protein [Paucisalibacillus globulus]|uniref:hypothetical protein n=1 Tax=Paucisalibacillus globulus TaxID=351095 RepID=UPI00041E459B|nr:hypothetical protein [Paucisalibacillus globulus]
MFEFHNYSPKIYTYVSDIIMDYKSHLIHLKGKKIVDIWIAWDKDNNEWFNDCPVLIGFYDCQLELCAYKSDEYKISFNQIPVSQSIDWYGTDFKLEWVKNKLPSLTSLNNQLVKHIEIIEVYSGGVGTSLSLYGVGFQLVEGYFAVCNGLDENIITTERPDSLNYKCTII